MQRFAAHPPAIVIPPQKNIAVAVNAGWQIMAPAPKLPSVFEDAADARSAPIRIAAATTPSPQQPVVSPVAAHPLLAAYQTQLARLAQTQQAFATQQAQIHQRFLSVRQASMQLFLQAAAGNTRMTPQMSVPHAQPLDAVVRTAPAQIRTPTLAVVETARVPASLEPLPKPAKNDRAMHVVPTAMRTPVGPAFSRQQLEVHADGRISQLFGPAFVGQDACLRQVRMPRPPLLLADRVTGLSAAADSMGKGTIWTETDAGWDHPFLHQGYLPAGILIEAASADLMLISYLGVDRLNNGERVYRLLGCELTYHGDLPAGGDTLRFEIELDGHAAQGDVRLMFFHYDCWNGARQQLSVRNGQAGFFTDAELAESAGCLWSPEQQEIVDQPRLDPAAVAQVPTQLQRHQLEALAAGDGFGCFGAGFERTQTHTRTPGLQGGRMLLLDRVTQIDSAGGPWGRGYLRAELDIAPEQWFFDGHFKNDPCMPGTLMFGPACRHSLSISPPGDTRSNATAGGSSRYRKLPISCNAVARSRRVRACS